jgi:ABC-type transport system involved in cytochrome c biogenesis permease component
VEVVPVLVIELEHPLMINVVEAINNRPNNDPVMNLIIDIFFMIVYIVLVNSLMEIGKNFGECI